MRRTRFMSALFAVSLFLLAVAPAAFARSDGGEGFYGETDDKVITNTMFIVIGAIPVLILVLTLIQTRLDKRKYARINAAKRRSASVDWRGGW